MVLAQNSIEQLRLEGTVEQPGDERGLMLHPDGCRITGHRELSWMRPLQLPVACKWGAAVVLAFLSKQSFRLKAHLCVPLMEPEIPC